MFSKLIKNPSGITPTYKEELAHLASKYPYSQIIAALNCKTSQQNSDEYKQVIARAALLFPKRELLYHFINQPEKLIPVAEFYQSASDPATDEMFSEIMVMEDAVEADQSLPDENHLQSEVIAENSTEVTEYSEFPLMSDSASEEVEEETSIKNQKEETYETSIPEVENEIEDRFDLLSAIDEPEAIEEETLGETDEQEIIEEIHDIADHEISEAHEQATDFEVETLSHPAEQQMEVYENVPASEENEKYDDEMGNDVISAAMSDYFAFESADIETAIPHMEEPSANVPVAEHPEVSSEQTPAKPANKVSNYNDSKLPYTFLWWLDKTRREHSNLYQPYAQAGVPIFTPVKSAQATALDQQIIEHVFHLRTPFDDDDASDTKTRTIEFKLSKKEDELIERFIKEEPQIKPLKPEQINNENKARKSAEDGHDLVSETLAVIYIEQMLYHKAIEVYQKLSLKFPDKKLYFADQIKQLEQKIN